MPGATQVEYNFGDLGIAGVGPLKPFKITDLVDHEVGVYGKTSEILLEAVNL